MNLSLKLITAIYNFIYRPDKYIETSEHGLVIMNVNEMDAGRYDCKMGGDIVCSYNITVDAHRCTAPTRTNDYQKVFFLYYLLVINSKTIYVIK